MWPGGLSLPDGTVAIIPLTPDQHAYLKDEAEARDIPLAMLLIQKVGQMLNEELKEKGARVVEGAEALLDDQDSGEE